ncbi:MAG TPA: GGDEF domain-containing protein [Nitrospirae bacterium]|nr:GGDEF domain-containing protein [Nitrospirota bacterium]HDY70720.1 GGDEF domain-containing protein [Nitrospirota bacterium]
MMLWNFLEGPFMYFFISFILFLAVIYQHLFFLKRLRLFSAIIRGQQQFHSSLSTREILLKASSMVKKSLRNAVIQPLVLDKQNNTMTLLSKNPSKDKVFHPPGSSVIFNACIENRSISLKPELLKDETDLLIAEAFPAGEFLLFPLLTERFEYSGQGFGRISYRCYGADGCMFNHKKEPGKKHGDCMRCSLCSPFGAFVVGKKKGALRKKEIRTLRSIICQRSLFAALSNAQRHEIVKGMLTTDELTGVKNYRGLIEELNKELGRARREENKVGLLFIDVNNFGNYNKLKGHLAGNQFLKELSQCLSGELRVSDYVARFGGDEFVIVMPGVDREGAAKIEERVEKAANGTIKDVDHPVSIGIAVFPDDGITFEELITFADAAMRESKWRGRGL